jgi:hypothetical protein
MSSSNHGRRRFLQILVGALPVGLIADPAHALGLAKRPATRRADHPDPRPGIDGSKVLPADRVSENAREAYDGVRRAAAVADGIHCPCGCSQTPGMYSLLSCFEESGMAQFCDICKGCGRLVAELHGDGRTLDEIRAAVDRRRW